MSTGDVPVVLPNSGILSADGALRALFDGPDAPVRVHSVFRRTMNLVHPTQGLIAVCEASVDDAPASLRVSATFWSDLVPGDTGTLGRGRVAVGRTSAVASDSTLWWAPTRSHLTDAGRARLSAGLAAVRAASGTGGPPGSGLDAAIRHALHSRADALADALLDRDGVAAGEAASGLVGLGHGLTPSGDDLLTGTLLVATMPGSDLGWARPVLVVDLTDRTTDIAVAMLREAGRGRFRQVLLDLSDAVALGREASGPAGAVARIGSSSGTDMLLGVGVGLRALQGFSGAAGSRWGHG